MAAACVHCAEAGQRCGLKFGVFFQKTPGKEQLLRTADYLTVWLGTHSKAFGNRFNPYWHGRMLERVRAQGSTAIFYAYIIAMLARHMKGIKDCDVGSPSLCVHGADFVRQNEGVILELYEQYANQTARWLGRGAEVVWLMEPDWHQYHEATQRGGGLTQAQMVRLFGLMVDRIKRHLPVARISFDISPWVRHRRRLPTSRCLAGPLSHAGLCPCPGQRPARLDGALPAAHASRLLAYLGRPHHRQLGPRARSRAGQFSHVGRAPSGASRPRPRGGNARPIRPQPRAVRLRRSRLFTT